MNKSMIGFNVLASILLSVPAFALGVGTSGGGNTVGNVPLDAWLYQDLRPYYPEKSDAYKEVLEPRYKKISGLVPDVILYLEEGFKQKRWYLDSREQFDEKLCLNSSILKVGKRIVACQDDIEVRISKNWYDDPNTRLIDQAYIINHELLMTKKLNTLKNPDSRGFDQILDSGIQWINYLMLQGPLDNANELRNEFLRNNFGQDAQAKYTFVSANNREIILTELKNMFSTSCKYPYDNNAPLVEGRSKFLDKSMDGSNNQFVQQEYLSLSQTYLPHESLSKLLLGRLKLVDFCEKFGTLVQKL